MKQAQTLLNAEQRARIEEAIARAESQTDVEFVIVIATRSGRYDRAEDLFGLLLGLAAVVVAWILAQRIVVDSSGWVTHQTLALGLVTILALLCVWTAVGVVLSSRLFSLARPFISRSQLEAEVRRHGFEAFHRFRVGHTSRRTALLIFVSLLERMAWVSGDEAVEAAVGAEAWRAPCNKIVAGFRTGRAADGLIQAITMCAETLAPAFPKTATDQDELPNRVRTMN